MTSSLDMGSTRFARFEMRPTNDPWRGRQPKYEKLVRFGPSRFGLVTELPSGAPIPVPVGRFANPS
jgi:hypothetical protein